MRRLLVILGLVAGLAVPVSAHAATTVFNDTIDATITLCNGDPVHLTGPLLVTVTATTSPAGGQSFAIHFQPQGVAGVDLVTGTLFRGTGVTSDVFVTTPPGGIIETYVNRFQIQATRGAQSYIVTNLFHVTAAPDGTLRVVVDTFSSSC
jgi:hypothetical protein